jgi:hypothetical protein
VNVLGAPPWKTAEVRDAELKALFPIESTELGSVTVVRPVEAKAS